MSILNTNLPADTDYLSVFPALWRQVKATIQNVLNLEHTISGNVYIHTKIGFPCDNDQFSSSQNTSPVTYNIRALTKGGGLQYYDGTNWNLLPLGLVANITTSGTFNSQYGITYQVIASGTGTVTITGTGFTTINMQVAGDNQFDMFQFNGTLTVTLTGTATVWILPI